MGRKKKYKTEKELLEARRRWRMEWYHRNKKVEQEKARERYRKKKLDKKLP